LKRKERLFFRVSQYYLLRYLSCLCRRLSDINFIQGIQHSSCLPKLTFPRVLRIKGRQSSPSQVKSSQVKSRSHKTTVAFMTLIPTCNLSSASISCNRLGPVSVCLCVCVFWTEDRPVKAVRIWAATFI